VAMCMKEPYTRRVFAHAPRLRMVFRYGVGVDTIDLDAATEYGVMVGYMPDFCIEEVANHALAHLLVCAKRICQLNRAIRSQGWDQARAMRSPMGAIHGETLGLIAFGNIARATAKRGKMLGMTVIASDPYVAPKVFEEAGVESVSLGELAARADYVSCHLPLNDATRNMIDMSFFGQMKPTAYFINTSRGPVVREEDLLSALDSGLIAGAGLDVVAHEPIQPDHPFCVMDNVTLTPHSASFADSTMAQRARRVGYNVLEVCRGGLPESLANPAVLEHRRYQTSTDEN
jgi:D-3-phosphoglycerate dehydrogenase